MFKPSWTIIVRSSTNVSSVEYGIWEFLAVFWEWHEKRR